MPTGMPRSAGAWAPAARSALRRRLAGSDGQELQRLTYGAAVAQAATGGGCDITVGPGGQFERLDGDLLARLLEQNRGAVCICSDARHARRRQPGAREPEPRGADRSSTAAGCRRRCKCRGRFLIGGLAALELRDLAIVMAEGGAAAAIDRGPASLGPGIGSRNAAPGGPLLQVSGATRMRMSGCELWRGAARVGGVRQHRGRVLRRRQHLPRAAELLWPAWRRSVARSDEPLRRRAACLS